MARTRPFLAATLLLAAAFLPSAEARAQGGCEQADVAVLPSPVSPWKGAPLRVIVAAEKPLEGELKLIAPNGSVAATGPARNDGPPYVWYAEVAQPAAGTWRAQLTSTRCGVTRDITVAEHAPTRPGATAGSVWPLHASWNRANENLYSAWVEKLFDSPLEALPSWNALHEVLRDRSRNALFNHLGAGEDEAGLVIRPDCADMPYFLRAYFAFKVGLPFGYAKCSRGGGGQAPKCFGWFSVQSQETPRASANGEAAASTGSVPRRSGLTGSFGQYLQTVGDAVHSGTGRTLAGDDNTDYYSVKLTQETLRPGTIYADPFGHVLMLTRRVPQTPDSAGVFLAADAQPDGSGAIKRFWRGNFLYAQDPALGTAGFKRFRPIVRGENGALRRLTNAEIAKNPSYADFSLEPSKLAVEAFYDRMDDVMSPTPLDPMRAMTEAITALEEQVKVRVTSVENGRKFQNSGKGEAAMPDGPAIFETTGAWEDFSTPSRDLRILIAIDVVRHFPDRVMRRPDRYAMPAGKSAADVQAEMHGVLASELAARKFSYPRSDGSPWTLTLKDVLNRMTELEMAYNPNDCVELRWGASENSQEAATCKRHASLTQRAKMSKYRAWFHERRRPPRA
jgi:hypothetical protein